MGKKYIGCNFSLGQFSWGAVFLGVIYPRGNYVDDKSSERQFSSGAISKEILSGSNYLWSNCPGAIIQDQSSRGTIILGTIILGSNYPWGNFYQEQLSGGQSSRGAIVRGTIIWGQFSSEAIVRTPYMCIYVLQIYLYMCYIHIYTYYIYTLLYIYIYENNRMKIKDRVPRFTHLIFILLFSYMNYSVYKTIAYCFFYTYITCI